MLLMKKMTTLAGLAFLLSLASSAFAQLDSPWTASGTGAVTVVEDGSSGIAEMNYDAGGVWGVWYGSWVFETVADTDKTITLAYKYRWHHSWHQSTVGLSAYINGVAIPLQPGDGEVELQLSAGDSYGFYMTGSHFDRSLLLQGTLTIEAVVMDGDGDGVADDIDLCPATPDGAIVNRLGCSGAQAIELVCPAGDEYKNHGQYVSCVSNAAEAAIEDGLLTDEEAEEIVSAAAHSNVGKPAKSKGKK